VTDAPTTSTHAPDPPTGASTATADATSPRGLLIPRGLVMLSAGWIFACWVYLFGFHPPVQPQAASYGPSIHLLFILMGVGIAIGWPLLRLSGRPSSVPVAQAALDAVSVFVLIQVVVWPLRLVTSWTLPRTIVVDSAIAAAIAMSAALLAVTQGSTRARVRWSAMACAVLVVLLPWMLDALWVGSGGTAYGPLGGFLRDTLEAGSAPALLARFSEPATLDPTDADRALAARAIALALVAWIAVGAARVRPGAAGLRNSPAKR
jgi:hypothetical protein